jgi:hypothetical protein
MVEYTVPCKGIVAYSQHDWNWEDMLTREPQADEFLVEMIATGVCHTDISGYGGIYPRVLGHEGTPVSTPYPPIRPSPSLACKTTRPNTPNRRRPHPPPRLPVPIPILLRRRPRNPLRRCVSLMQILHHRPPRLLYKPRSSHARLQRAQLRPRIRPLQSHRWRLLRPILLRIPRPRESILRRERHKTRQRCRRTARVRAAGVRHHDGCGRDYTCGPVRSQRRSRSRWAGRCWAGGSVCGEAEGGEDCGCGRFAAIEDRFGDAAWCYGGAVEHEGGVGGRGDECGN